MSEGMKHETLTVTSRVADDGQVTVPEEIRKALHIDRGDTLSFRVEGDRVVMTKEEPFDIDWHRALSSTLDEWNSPEDEEAYRDL